MSVPRLFLSWTDFHKEAHHLGQTLKALGEWRGIMAITRGGLIPSAIIASDLNIRVIETICVVSYDAEETQTELKILKSFKSDEWEQGKDLLVLDDLVDSGRTLSAIRQMLPKAHYGAVYAKPQGKGVLDTFGVDIPQETWIVFPWEIFPVSS